MDHTKRIFISSRRRRRGYDMYMYKNKNIHQFQVVKGKSLMVIILMILILGMTILSHLADASEAEPKFPQEHLDGARARAGAGAGSSTKKRFSQSIHSPQPKMNGRPVMYDAGSIARTGSGGGPDAHANTHAHINEEEGEQVIMNSYSYSPFSDVVNGSFVENIHSKAAYFIGKCSVDAPFQFVVGGFSGKGVIGTPPSIPQTQTSTSESGSGSESGPSLETFVTSINFIDPIDDEGGEIVALMDQIQSHFFTFSSSSSSSSSWEPNNSNNTSPGSSSKSGSNSRSDFLGVPFVYNGVDSQALSPISVSCSSNDPIDMIVIVGDDEHQDISATISHTLGSDAVHVELTGGARSNANLRAETIYRTSINGITDEDDKHSPSGGQGRRHLRTIRGGGSPNDIWLKKAPKRRSLEAKTAKDDFGCSLIQMTIHNSLGKEVPKTLVVCSEYHDNLRSRKLQQSEHNIRLESADIDENGDVVFRFTGLENLELLKVSTIRFYARIAIECKNDDEAIEVVDMSAMVSWNDLTLVVNGGWFRRAVKLHEVNCDWEPVVLNAIATDPDAKYTFLGRLVHPTTATIMEGNASGRNLSVHELSSRRNILKASPSEDELAINENMTRGRKPETFSNSLRNLQSQKHRKILVHGYCDTESDFPLWQFTDAVQFIDPDSSSPKASSWSNDQFARKISKFAVDNDIDGCGIIGHSQGGTAALHLMENYWSCLDNSSTGSRLIQSVGTPYQGTLFAGTIANIGQVFGVGCGGNYDLTEDGATRWLRSISPTSKEEVYYYLTGAPTGWFTIPCLFSADVFLADPEDGVVERSRGELPGGNNAGYTAGQCHTDYMRYDHQCLDSIRNSEMNSKAKY